MGQKQGPTPGLVGPVGSIHPFGSIGPLHASIMAVHVYGVQRTIKASFTLLASAHVMDYFGTLTSGRGMSIDAPRTWCRSPSSALVIYNRNPSRESETNENERNNSVCQQLLYHTIHCPTMFPLVPMSSTKQQCCKTPHGAPQPIPSRSR